MLQRLTSDISKLKAPEGYLYAGLPRFLRLFGRDSCISALQLLEMEPEIARHTLLILAKYQGKKIDKKRGEEPGKIIHEHYAGGWVSRLEDFLKNRSKKETFFKFLSWKFPYYGSIDATAWFLILLSAYFDATKDRRLVEDLWPQVKKAITWTEKYGNTDKDPFIETKRKNPAGLFHQSWKDRLEIHINPPIAMVEVQGYYYKAFLGVANLSRKVMHDKKFAKKLEHKAEKLKKEFNKKFWMKEEKYFALALSGRKKQIKFITSNPGHLLFTGILDEDKEVKVIERLFQDDMLTPYGIRTESENSPNFNPESYHHGSIWPHDNWIIYMGLLESGYTKQAKIIKNATISAYTVLDSIPELYTVKNNEIHPQHESCYLQAWSTGALVNMLMD